MAVSISLERRNAMMVIRRPDNTRIPLYGQQNSQFGKIKQRKKSLQPKQKQEQKFGRSVGGRKTHAPTTAVGHLHTERELDKNIQAIFRICTFFSYEIHVDGSLLYLTLIVFDIGFSVFFIGILIRTLLLQIKNSNRLRNMERTQNKQRNTNHFRLLINIHMNN